MMDVDSIVVLCGLQVEHRWASTSHHTLPTRKVSTSDLLPEILFDEKSVTYNHPITQPSAICPPN